ncbi:MAG: FMN-binding protein [Candidatus Binatia bacterium]
MRRLLALVTLAACVLFPGMRGQAPAAVFHSRDEALALAFPGAERTEARDFFLTPEQRSEIETRARARLDSSFLTVYVGHRGAETLGYALFDTHLVRTLPETFLIVLDPEGAVKAAYLLAFYEPPEYQPPDRWLAQFPGRRPSDDVQVDRTIAGITGSTLTARAVTGGVRRALAIYEVLLRAR